MQAYMKDIILAVVFFIYPFVLLVASKMLDRTGVRKDLSRKLVHVGMGLVILFIPFFDHKWIALIPPIIFTAINAIDYKWGIFSQIQGEDKGNIGTILYPISYIVLISIFYGTAWWGLAVLGIFAMAFGDAAASIVGREFGKLKYYIAGETRSYAGSFAMLILTFAVAVVVFYFYGANMGMVIRLRTILAASFFVAGASTVIEALSIKGSDNITVPLLTAFIAWFLLAVLMPSIFGNQEIVNQPLY